MNKLEFLEKMEEVDALIADGKYDLAVEICDTLNLSGVKEPRRLQNIAKAYERCRRYKEAEVLLQRVRRQVPRSRGVLFRLCSVSVRAGELEDAKDYLSDFIDLAPTDPERLILEYRIAEAENRPDAERITILEKYLSEETDDRWMYTLAELYVRNGREEEAAGVLNAIVLWFDSGRYVAKAHAMLVKLGYEEAPAEALEDVPVVPETRTEFPEVEFETPEEVARQESEESEEASAEEEPAEEAEEAAPAAEIEEAETEVSEAAGTPEEAETEAPEAEDEHIVVNITNPRDSGHILRRLDEEDDAVWAQVFDAEDEKEAAAETPQEEAAEVLQEAVSEEAEAAEEYGELAEEAAEEAVEEVEEAHAAFDAEEFEDDEYDVDEEDDDAEEAVGELPEEAAPAEEVAEAIPEAAAEETKEVTEAVEEAAAEAALPEEEAAEAEEPVQKAPEETAAPLGNFKHEEYGEVIAAEIRRRKEERIKFGNIPVEPDMSTSIWHFIAYGETDELALECAREHVKEIAGINPNCPGKLLKISAEKIGKASIVSSLDRFLGNVVIVERVSLLSDEQLQEFAKVLDHDDMSLLTVFTDNRENIINVLKRVPALAGAFSAVYEGKKYTADDLILAAESYLRGEEARLSDAAEAVVRNYAEDILQEKRGFYRNRVIAYVGKALEAADKGGFLGFGAGRIDKNGILVVDAKHFRNL